MTKVDEIKIGTNFIYFPLIAWSRNRNIRIVIGFVWFDGRSTILGYLRPDQFYTYHHHVVPPAWISLTLSRYFFLSFITSGRSSGLYPVSSQSYCMYVRAARPAFARPYVGVHRSTSFMSSSLLLQQFHACLVRLTWDGR